MNCTEFQELLVAHAEGALDPTTAADCERHLSSCPACRGEHETLGRLRQGLITRGQAAAGVTLAGSVMARIREQQPAREGPRFSGAAILRWLLGATTATAAVAFLFVIAGTPASKAKAADVLTRAINAVAELNTVHLVAQVRGGPADNFSQINPKAPFSRIEMWKELTGQKRWRIEKPGRVAAMDGRSTTLLLRPLNTAMAIPRASSSAFDTEWLQHVANIEAALTQALKMAQTKGWKMDLTKRMSASGVVHTDVTIDTPSGVAPSDYLFNKFFASAETRRIYAFDDASGRLESLQIFIRDGANYTLVFEVTQIDYNPPFAPEVFAVELPPNVNMMREPQPIADNARYAAMSPQQAARAFFEACAREDWAEAEVFLGVAPNDRLRNHLGGLLLVQLGEPFTSAATPAQFVPYEIQLRDGTAKKHNLTLKKHPRAGRWMIDGGI